MFCVAASSKTLHDARRSDRKVTPKGSILHFSTKSLVFVPGTTKTAADKDFSRQTANSFPAMFTDSQTNILRALVNCIVPADDYPGGWDAGVGEYLARLLTQEPQFLFAYHSGLDALKMEAPEFPVWMPDAQNALLMRLEQDKVQGAFFRLLVTHVMEGFYAGPGSGGNRNGIAWQMIGYQVTA
jgi:hypothetical protein